MFAFTPYERLLVDLGYVDAAQSAAQAACDAILINSFADYGIEAASQRYFDKSARELTLAEAALIAGLLKAPSKYSPAQHLIE